MSMAFELNNDFPRPSKAPPRLQLGLDLDGASLGVTGPDCFSCDRYANLGACPFRKQGASGCPQIKF
jgi:hypothetical protein